MGAAIDSVLSPQSSVLRRGVGIACGIKNVGYSFGFPEQATCTVELHAPAGRTRVKRAAAAAKPARADVRQGAHLTMRQIAAEALGLGLDAVELVSDDSSQAPNAGSASASRLTTVG